MYWVPLATVIVGVVAVVVATGARRGALLSPFSTVVILLTAIFGGRPLFMIVNGDYAFYRADVSAGMGLASAIGLSGLVALCTGYALGRLRTGTRALRAGPPEVQSGSMAVNAALACGVLLAWLIASAVLGGGLESVATSFDGRSVEAGLALKGVPAIVPALPVVAGVLIVVSRLRIERVRRLRPPETCLYWAITALSVIPPTALGNRRFLIPTILAALIGACGRSWSKRPGLGLIVGASVVVLMLMIVPFIRSAGSRTDSSDFLGAMMDRLSGSGVSGVIGDFFLSYDTEMYSYIALIAPQLGSGGLPFGAGRGTLLDGVIAPLPASWLPGPSWSDTVLTYAFGGGCGEVFCPVPSLFGTLYFDFAFPGVVLGAVLVGFGCAVWERRFQAATGPSLTALLVLGAFAPVAARGNAVSLLWIAAQVIVVVIVLQLLSGRASGFRLFDQARPPAAPPSGYRPEPRVRVDSGSPQQDDGEGGPGRHRAEVGSDGAPVDPRTRSDVLCAVDRA